MGLGAMKPKRGRPAMPWTCERLMEWVKIDPETGCWNWQGGSTNDGYGLLGSGRDKNRLAHRRSYGMFIGPIPEGLQIDHLCKRRSCCNPAHLEAVTTRENMRRITKTHCKRGHPLSGDNLKLVKKGRSCRACGLMHARAFEARNPGRNNHLRRKSRSEISA